MKGKRLTRRQLIKSAGLLAGATALAACAPAPQPAPAAAPPAATSAPAAKQPAPTAAPAAKQPVDLMLWTGQLGTLSQTGIEAVLAQFNKDQTEVVVKSTHFNGEEYKAKVLSTAFAGGQPPDVFASPGFEWLFQYAKAGEIEDLTAWYKERQSRFTPGLEGALESQGKLYAAPFTVGATGFVFYNKKIFADNGLTTADLGSFEAWQSACDKLKAKGIVPIAFGNKQKWPTVHWTANTVKSIMGADKAYDFFTLKSGKWSDPLPVEGLKAFMTFLDKGHFNVGAATEDNKVVQDSFIAGKMAMYVGANNIVQLMAQPNATIDGDFVEFPAMAGKPGKPGDWVCWTNAYAVAKKTKSRAGALKLLDALASGKYQRISYDVSPGFYAAKDALSGAQVHPLVQKLVDLYGKTTRLLPIPDLTLPLSAAAVFYDELAGMVSKQVTVEKAAANIDAAVAKEVMK